VSGTTGVIVHQGALGDFLLALPVIEGLHRASPHLKFDFWSRTGHLSLLYGKPYVASAFEASGAEWMPFYDNDRWKDCPLPRGVAEACCILVFGQASSVAAVERLKVRTLAPVHWIKSFPGDLDDDERRHVTEFLEDQVKECHLPLVMAPLQITPAPEELTAVRQLTRRSGEAEERRQVVIHPGSGGLRKIWPLSRWRVFLQSLRERKDIHIFMVMGPADERIRPLVQEIADGERIPVVDNLQLPALAALLSDADLYVGNDSGVTHLAASLGTPTVAIFGPTDPVVWGPRGLDVEIFKDFWDQEEFLVPFPAPTGSLSVSQLVSLVEAKLDAGPHSRESG
jgi:ADP-heptose:LPS heptosyltransferase